MINKPYSLLPSDFTDGRGVVDIESESTFSFYASGTSPIYMMAFEFCDISGTPTSSVFFEPPSPIYYTDISGNPIQIEWNAVVKQYVGDNSSQQWRVLLWDEPLQTYHTAVASYDGSTTTAGTFTPDYAVASDWTFVQLKSTPSASLQSSGGQQVTVKSNTWLLQYEPSYAYDSRQLTSVATPTRSVRWAVYDVGDPSDPIADTGELYGCVAPQYTVDGLRSGHKYYATVTVVDQDGVETSARSADVSVSYAQGPGGIMLLSYLRDFQLGSGVYGSGQEIALDISHFSGSPGVSSSGKDGYEIENVGGDVGYVLENKTGNTITYDGIDGSDYNTKTLRLRFTPKAYIGGDDIAILYLNEEESIRIRYVMRSDGGLTPSESLTPSASLIPSVRSYSIVPLLETADGYGGWAVREELIDGVQSVDIGTIGDGFVYYEHIIDDSEIADVDYEQYVNKPSINGVELAGDVSLSELGLDDVTPLSTDEIDDALGWG